MNKEIDYLENQELIKKIMDHGFEEMVKFFYENEDKIYTKKDRLNKSGACRVLGWKHKHLEEALEECRKILEKDD